jgi:hypothetical protein
MPDGTALHTLPIDGELLVSPTPRLDVGFDFELVGYLGATFKSASTWRASSFAATRIFGVFVQGRI